ncbi:MAG: alpha/beta hydrolase [Phycisphaerales bacterium]|nr:alpha/beta hydrolase [Phycisphaerales bacterium]
MRSDSNAPLVRPMTRRGRLFRRLIHHAAGFAGLRHATDRGWPRFEGGTDHADPPIVLVHGFGVDGTTMLQLGRRLVKRNRVIVPDLPGFGLHPRHEPASIDFAHLLESIDDLISTLGLSAPVLVGSSMGGAIAAGYAASRPDAVAGLVVIGPAGIEPPIDTEVFAAAKRDEHLLRIESTEDFERVYDLNFTKAPWMPRWMKGVVAREAAHRADDHEIVLRNLESVMLGSAERFRTVTCPTEIVWGGDDRIIHRSAAALWDATIPQANLTIVEQAGHSTMVERPDEIASIVENLLTKVRSHDR